MTITINGDSVELKNDLTVAELMDERGLSQAGTAVAIDAAVVPAAQWETTVIHDGAVVDILTAVQGG